VRVATSAPSLFLLSLSLFSASRAAAGAEAIEARQERRRRRRRPVANGETEALHAAVLKEEEQQHEMEEAAVVTSSSATSGEEGGHLPQGWVKRKRSRRQRSEENLALCLLMLARGGHHRVQAPPPLSTTGPAPVGAEFKCSVYGKSFSFYQALGGHKTSHWVKLPTPLAPPATATPPLGGAAAPDRRHPPVPLFFGRRISPGHRGGIPTVRSPRRAATEAWTPRRPTAGAAPSWAVAAEAGQARPRLAGRPCQPAAEPQPAATLPQASSRCRRTDLGEGRP
ncbi:hypothetical protein EE612_037816, partial [Oryza sativa]